MNMRTLSITTAFFASISLNMYAEDIEIYDGTIGDGSEVEYQPNVLFILDTSGSMTGVIASSSGDLNYDADEDYGDDGDATDDTYIYVYDDDKNYTGVYFEPEQVVCQELIDTLDSNPDDPEYTDQALQWQAEIVNEGGITTCTGSEEETETISASDISVTNGGASHIMGPIDASDVADGTNLEFYVNVPDRGRVDYQLQYFTTYWQTSTCSSNAGGMDGGSGSCSVNTAGITSSATQYRIEISEADNGPDTSTFDATFTYTETTPTGCTTTGGTDEYQAQWSADFKQSSDIDWVLECDADQGVNGLTSSSTDNYLALCPDNACTSPNYTSYAAAGLDWETSGYPTYTFYSGNYHDFKVANPIPDDVVLTEQDSDSYCSSSTYEDWFYETGPDGEKTVYQCQRKWEIMEAAVTDLVVSTQDVDVGLMRFFDVDESDDNGGSVILAVDDIDAELPSGLTQEEAMIAQVENLEYRTNTPLSETLYEAYRYFAGLSPVYEDSSIDDENAYDSSGNYISPASAHSCESNNIIYLTDGSPVSDSNADDEIEDLIGTSCDGNCLDDLSHYMANNDIIGSTEEIETVNTYTVGFGIDLELMENAATVEDGYRNANNYSDLSDAFSNFIELIAESSPATLVAPAVSVNAFNELQHRDQIFYAVFSPDYTPKWNGNIKKYKLDDGEVVDQNNSPAVNSSTGFFSTSATSYWSNVVDGDTVELGGVRGRLEQDRRVYVGGNVLATPQSGIIELTDSLELSQSLLGVSTEEEAATIRDWILGEDVDDSNENPDKPDASQYIADLLHSKPFVVTYKGSSEADAEDVLFFTTNAGFIHAVDATGGGQGEVNSGGTELWSYIPSDLIGNTTSYLENAAGDHVYGLDGHATVYTEEATGSSSAAFELETVKIYQGMRRGGNNYYAWDVSNALESTIPILEEWVISGGSGGFADLGQTWSQMLRTELSYNCEENGDGCTTVDVLVFSGGYDTYYDDQTVFPLDAANAAIKGNSLYIVNAETGALIWSAGGDGGHNLNLPMYNSFPATPTVIDIDSDGDMDMLFAIDISGKIWRMDFDQTATSADDYAQGGMIANLGDTSTDGFLRFYNALDASVTIPNDAYPYFNLVVGSGYRAHPKDSGEPTNNLFVVYDDYVIAPKDDNDDGQYEYSYTDAGGVISFKDDDLYAASDSSLAEKGTTAVHGFYLTLPDADEKILNPTLTFNGRVVVTSYVPEAGYENENGCGGTYSTGGGNVYVVDLQTGESIFSTELSVPGIPPETSTILTDDGLTVCVGTECSTPPNPITPVGTPPTNLADALGFDPGTALRTFWRQE